MIIRSLGRPLIVTLLAIATVAAIVVSANSATPIVQYIGNSAGEVRGNATLFTMNLECFNSFGSGARMCSSQEFLETQNISVRGPKNTIAWIKPTITVAFFDPSIVVNTVTGSEVYVDASGATALSPDNLSCAQWTSNDGTQTGLAVVTNAGSPNTGGNAVMVSCDSTYRVACCGPP